MILKADEVFLPAIDSVRDLLEYEHMEHGVNVFVPPATTALQKARRRVNVLNDSPNTATILTTSPHECVLLLQHWIQRGWYVADDSVLMMTEDFQSIQLFKKIV